MNTEYFDLFVDRDTTPGAVAGMWLDEIASQVADLIDTQSDHDWPLTDDGEIDLYAIATAIKYEANRRCAEDIWEEHNRIYNR